MTTELEIPTSLPVDHLSVSSVNLFLRCPEKWRRRYIDQEYEGPVSSNMILGSAVGAAEGHADQQVIDDGYRPSVDQVVDLFADEFEDRTGREEIDWGERKPGEVKDTGVGAVKAYEKDIAPTFEPVSVERRFTLQLEGVEWGFIGYFDVEDADGRVRDRKVRGRKLASAEADTDIQPTGFLLARRAEGNRASGFVFDTMVKTKTPYAEPVPTDRTDAQLDAFTHRLYGIAAEIHWRLENDVWAGAAPGAWWCSNSMCGYWDRCQFGGLR